MSFMDRKPQRVQFFSCKTHLIGPFRKVSISAATDPGFYRHSELRLQEVRTGKEEEEPKQGCVFIYQI